MKLKDNLMQLKKRKAILLKLWNKEESTIRFKVNPKKSE